MKSILILILGIFTWVHGSSPEVEINAGKLAGTTYTLPNGRVVYAFLGVPFAAPPVDHNRFEPPKPVQYWSGYRNATYPGKACIQFIQIPGINDVTGEDCLYLNVFTPELPRRKKYSKLMNVMVDIHGGGFLKGSGSENNPDYILQSDDIVYVSINYRLGFLGFFTTNHLDAPGNNGLKDQVAALQWIRENIIFFGGDPSKVTIYGTSAGGASVHFHLISPLSRGLFQNAISSSGSALNPWALTQNVTENSLKLVSLLNCPVDGGRLMLRCLKIKPIGKILEAMAKQWPHREYVSDMIFSPVIEPKHRRAFLSRHPYSLTKNRKISNVPWMISTTEDEGSVVAVYLEYVGNKKKLKYLNDNWNAIAPELFLYGYLRSKTKRDYISSNLKKFYFNKKNISKKTQKRLLQALGDRWMYNGINEATKLHAAANYENVYCFKFSYRGSESFCDKFTMQKYGTCHCDDMLYLINPFQRKLHHNRKDKRMIKFMTSSMIAFMKTGNPNTGIVNWEPVSKNGSINCLNIYSATRQKMEDTENVKSAKFWKDMLPNEFWENPLKL